MTKLGRLAGLAPTILVLASACGADSVKAGEYDQTCSTADDCVLVGELEAEGTRCKIRCASGAINKKDHAKFDADLSAARGDCTQTSKPFCDTPPAVACVRGTCSTSAAPADAGTD